MKSVGGRRRIRDTRRFRRRLSRTLRPMVRIRMEISILKAAALLSSARELPMGDHETTIP